MAKTLTVLGVHGLGDHRKSDWEARWTEAVRKAFPAVEGVTLQFRFVTYDHIFANTTLGPVDWAKAAGKLLMSGVFGARKGWFDGDNRVNWTAGYVVAWVENEAFQARTRRLILDAVLEHEPDIILAHSLGSLVTYNAFSHTDAQEAEVAAILDRARYVTFGSQIGNRFVMRNLTNGRIMPLKVSHWFHLFNKHDPVFTAEIVLQGASNFTQVRTPFDEKDDHAAEGYLGHTATIENVWRPVGAQGAGVKVFGYAGAPDKLLKVLDSIQPRRKALLVGINDYPVESQRLEGCINDVFTMSAVLQQCGFDPGEIRTCLNERATAAGILDRLEWLLSEARAGDELVFYYSGHGARVPEYGESNEPDHHVETLVPWDFDWTPERYVADDQLSTLYSQLPDGCRLVMIFDCCHSGGLHRDGGPRARGIAPPDDIRHRELKWDARTQMWVARDFVRINEDFAPKKERRLAEDYFGRNGATYRLGRAGMLRGLSSRQYEALKVRDPEMARGPYLPVIIEACGEEEYSYEYRHGASSHGAFTFSLASILRRQTGPITFNALVQQTSEQLEDLRYAQKPNILGPAEIVHGPVPFTLV